MLKHKRGKETGLGADGQDEGKIEEDAEMQQQVPTHSKKHGKKRAAATAGPFDTIVHTVRRYHRRHGTVRIALTSTLLCVIISILIYMCYFYSLGNASCLRTNLFPDSHTLDRS